MVSLVFTLFLLIPLLNKKAFSCPVMKAYDFGESVRDCVKQIWKTPIEQFCGKNQQLCDQLDTANCIGVKNTVTSDEETTNKLVCMALKCSSLCEKEADCIKNCTGDPEKKIPEGGCFAVESGTAIDCHIFKSEAYAIEKSTKSICPFLKSEFTPDDLETCVKYAVGRTSYEVCNTEGLDCEEYKKSNCQSLKPSSGKLVDFACLAVKCETFCENHDILKCKGKCLREDNCQKHGSGKDRLNCLVKNLDLLEKLFKGTCPFSVISGSSGAKQILTCAKSLLTKGISDFCTRHKDVCDQVTKTKCSPDESLYDHAYTALLCLAKNCEKRCESNSNLTCKSSCFGNFETCTNLSFYLTNKCIVEGSSLNEEQSTLTQGTASIGSPNGSAEGLASSEDETTISTGQGNHKEKLEVTPFKLVLILAALFSSFVHN